MQRGRARSEEDMRGGELHERGGQVRGGITHGTMGEPCGRAVYRTSRDVRGEVVHEKGELVHDGSAHGTRGEEAGEAADGMGVT